ncbi:hypothetical protein OGAPHI_006369 [Ogataea philodendri]|uniref:B30.2/SPRY domain-containing protein n=1 Tax=Ogataea philodendri TaxID=1378263 RepID=A0A9P8T1C5_9ASCO|nr:uncharacterized protein OGAPHI_006369 [Ogataea philodendri]KAH3661521.1 hypothetical protein OGAPHI_006369 [Ogataea philodendri]
MDEANRPLCLVYYLDSERAFHTSDPEPIRVVFSREIRGSQHQLCKNDTHCPDIDGWRVMLSSKQKLWASVPSGDDVGCQFFVWMAKRSGQTEIRQFQVAFWRDQQVIWFQIAMKNPVSMAMVQSSQSHQHPRLDICWNDHDLLVVYDHFKVRRKIFGLPIGAQDALNSASIGYMIVIGIIIGSSIVIVIALIIYLFHELLRKGIRLTNEFPGSIDDAALEAEEDRRALDELPPNEQELYFQAKDFLKLNPMNNQDLTLSQNLIIQEKGVAAWEFRPHVECQDLISVANKTEIEFKNSGQELSIQTNFPIPKLNEVYYFETKVYELPNPQDTIFSVGLSTSPYPFFRLPGRNRISAAYDSNGYRRFNQPFPLQPSTFPVLEHGDVIGCGLRTTTRTLFWTRNGKKISESKIGGHIKVPKNLQLYPTIGANNKCELHVNMGQAGYVFIEGNVKKWGFGPLEGNEMPPPLYTKFNKDVLLESSDLDPSDLSLRNGDFPPDFWDTLDTPAEFSEVEENITLHSLKEIQDQELEQELEQELQQGPESPPGYEV